MKGTITLLLCAVALAQGLHQNPVQRSSEAHQICQATYDSDNVLVAHEYCNQFYKCNHGKPVAFKCYGNLRYNPYTEQCDWPFNVNCGDRVIPNHSVSVPSVINPLGGSPDNICAPSDVPKFLLPHENCNQFYMCVVNAPVVFTCPKGLLFDPVEGQCDWPSNVDCGDRVIPDPDQSVTNPPGTTPEATIPGNNGNPSEAPAICAADGSDGVLVAHEKCNQFYKCSDGKPVAFLCPDGLLFNPTKDQCDWPFNVNCGDRVIPDHSVSVPSVINPLGGIPDNICASNGFPQALVPHENCNQFYFCVFNDPHVFTCPEGLMFDPPNGICDRSSDVDCGDRVIPDHSVSVPSVINPLGGTPDNICAPSDVPKFLLPHENCNQFYMCVVNAPVVFTCPKGLLFDPVEGQCDWPSNVDCGDRVIPDPDQSVTNPPGTTPEATIPGNNGNPSEAPAICAADGSDGVLVAHEKCNQFYKCSEGKPVAFLCPDGLLFNPTKDQCDWSFNVNCGDRVIPDHSVSVPSVINPLGGTPDNICAPSDVPKFLLPHENCNQFYMCVVNAPVVFTCPKGLLFDPVEGQCDWPSNVDCGDRVIPDPDQSVTNPPGTTPEATIPGNNGNPSEAPAICAADGSDGVLVAHEKCNQFYKCSEGKPVAFLCPDGLLFNPTKDQCDWSFNVNCRDRVIPDHSVSVPSVINPLAGSPDNICAPSDVPKFLLPHENCNQFYMCVVNAPVVFTCPKGLLFDPVEGQCDWPSNVDCGDRVIPDPDQSVTNPPGTTPEATIPGNNGNPSEAPAICAADGSDGVLVAHEKCNQFYKCSEGKPVAFLCPDGLLFNPTKDQCDWSFNVNCRDRVIPDHSVSVPSVINPLAGSPDNICAPSDVPKFLLPHENCNQFYMCVVNAPVVFTCPNGLLFDPVEGQCDWPSNVDCGDRVIPDPDQSVTNPPGTTPEATIPGNNGNPSEAPAICAADGSDGVLVAHEKCNQFYKCSEGKPVALLCPSGLLFNPANDQCDWPFNVDCGDRVIPDPDQSVTNPVVPNPPLTNPPATTAGATNPGNNCNPSEAPAICAANGSDGVLVAHEKCNQFYKCSEGKPVALLCPSGLLFNPANDQCDWPFNVDCGDRVIPDPDQSVTNPPVPNPPGTTPGATNPGNNCNPSEAPAICAADGSDGVLVAHEKCNQFYKCSEGKPVALLCPSGLLFNPANDQCDWPFNVDCGDRVIPDPDQSVTNPPVPNPPGTTPGATNPGNNCNPSEAPAICAANGSDGVLVAHEKCNQFYKCSEGKPVALLCPSGLLFNPANDQCDWPFNVDCGDRVIPDPDQSVTNPPVTNSPVPNPPGTTPGATNPGNNCNPSEAPAICAADGSDGVLVAHEKCNQFYKCSEGKPVALLCPSGLLFNPATDQCDWPFNVDCGDRVIPDPDQSVTNPPRTTPGATIPGNNGNPSEAPAICAADGSDGVLVAHEQCNQFYKCSEGKPVALLCPSGLLFNPANDQCDWPFNVECGDRILP